MVLPPRRQAWPHGSARSSRARAVFWGVALACATRAVALAEGAPATEHARDAPVIERVEPSAGPPGTLLTIRGRKLKGETRVAIGETPLSIQLSTPNLLTARVEAGTRSGVLHLQTRAGEVQGPEFTVMAEALAPIIERVQPARGAPGSSVVIHGRRFSQRISQNVVQFGSTIAIIASASAEPGAAPDSGATRLDVIVPEGAGSSTLSVRVLGAGEARSAQPFEIVRKLAVDGVVPPRAAPGARVEVRGSGFDASTRVMLATKPLRVLEAKPTRLLVLIPADAESGQLRVESQLAGSVQSAAPFEVLAPPVLTGVAPTVGPVGTEVVISGSGFGDDAAAIHARIGDGELLVRRVSPHELVLQVPSAAQSGKLSVQVGDHGQAITTQEFTVSAALAVTNLQPRSGPVGSEVRLTGHGFSPNTEEDEVMLSGERASVLRATPTELTLRVPDAKSAPLRVRVGPSQVETQAAFVVTHPPRITDVSANAIRTGAEFSVHGVGFGEVVALVRVFLDRQALEVVALHDDAIVVRAPAFATSGQLSVQVALQGGAVYPRPIQIVDSRGRNSAPAPASLP